MATSIFGVAAPPSFGPPALSPEFDEIPPIGVDATLWRVSTSTERTELLATVRMEAERDGIVGRIVKAGGSGTQADVDLVAAELRKLPVPALRVMESHNVKVIACRGSVTDYDPSLSGGQPRGWLPGSVWDKVPGAYVQSRNTVVIATRGHGSAGGAHVPNTGDGHGSANLVIHEAAHAVDRHVGISINSASPDFRAARQADFGMLTPHQQQVGSAGLSETYAESAARYYGETHGSTGTPALNAYWTAHPLGGN